MKRFLIRASLVMLLVVLADLIVGVIMKPVISNVPNAGTRDANVKRSICDATAQLLVIGSSAASHHYVPSLFKDSLGFYTYNSGRDAYDIFYSNAVLESFIERSRPEVVILDVRKAMFDSTWVNHIIDSKCFYKESKSLTKAIHEVSPWQEQLKLLSNLYKYNNSLPWVAYAYVLGDRQSDGYIPYFGTREDLVHVEYQRSDKFVLSEPYKKQLEQFFQTCINNDIRLYVCYSPCMVTNHDGFIEAIKDVCDEYNVFFFNYENRNEFSDHPELFVDEVHLNDEGARLFTNEIINELLCLKD